MKFAKVHGLGNDFIIINTIKESISEEYDKLAIQLCHRNFGIGADGLLVVLPSQKADIKMRIFNSDGSEPEMCGNGIRCFAKFVYEEGVVPKKKMQIETLAGLIVPEIILNNEEKVEAVKVDMGEPILESAQIPIDSTRVKVINEPLSVEQHSFEITAVSMGNPHCVIFVEDITKAKINEWGPLIETHKVFPRKTNVEFAQVVTDEEIIMRVWERGAGPTLACGTGACATLVAGVLTKQTKRKAILKLTGGDLQIEWADNNHVYMTGSAVEVFRGEVSL